MGKFRLVGLGFGLLFAGCQELPDPTQVKKVPECVTLFKAGIDSVGAKNTARALLEEKALTEEAVESIHQCWEQLPPETPNRDVLVAEILAWVKEWDSEGRPKYLAQFFSYWLNEPVAFEGRQMAAAAFTDRLSRVDRDDRPGLRAILSLLSKSLGDKLACVGVTGQNVNGKPMDRKQLLGMFATGQQVNPWLASGLELAFEPRQNCPGHVRVELVAGSGGSKLRAKVQIMRSDIILFDKEYPADSSSGLLIADFEIP